VEILKSQFVIVNEYIDVTPEVLKIPAKQERGFEIHYRPLIVKELDVAEIVLKNPVLGEFKYKLNLKAIAPSTQKSMAFKTSLGNDQVQTFKFTHFLKKPTTYTIKVERLDAPGAQCEFKSEVPQVAALAADSYKGVEISVNVRYEPFTIGTSKAIVKLNSPEGMEYTCLLFGNSVAPQP
jgi:hydrocephalus-inducing protein